LEACEHPKGLSFLRHAKRSLRSKNCQMDETLWHKFTQHLDLKEELLMTGDAELVEVLRDLFQTKRELTAV